MSEAKRPKLIDGSELEAINLDDKSNGSQYDENLQFEVSLQRDQSEPMNDDGNESASENESLTEELSLITLNADCLDEIFNFLSSIDVKSVGQTCKDLYKTTANYFKLKYPAKKLKIRMPLSYIKPNTTNGFGPFYRNVIVDDADIKIFQFLATNCANPLNKIQFGQKNSRKQIFSGFGMYIKNHLASVASIEFLGCRIHGDLYQLILQYCENLKRLSIRNYANEGIHIGVNDDWLLKRYRTLEHLALVKRSSKIEQLKQFFKKNRNIKSFTTTTAILWANKKVFQSGIMNLNELNIELILDDKPQIKKLAVFLNQLHDAGYFKQFKLRIIDASIVTEHVNDIASMHGLNGIYFDCDVIINEEFTTALTTLTTLTTIYIRQPMESETNKGNLFQGLGQLKAFYIQTITAELFAEQILTIIQQSSKINKIFIRKINGDVDIKLIKINEKRIKLMDAAKVKVFVDDDTFLNIQWKYLDTELSGIEVKRSDSDVTDHPFALHDE